MKNFEIIIIIEGIYIAHSVTQSALQLDYTQTLYREHIHPSQTH